MSEHKGTRMDDGAAEAGKESRGEVGNKGGQPSIVVSIPSNASEAEIEALEASIRVAKPTGNLSKEETFKTWLG